MKKIHFAFAIVATLVLLVSACAPQVAPATIAPTAMPPTAMPSTQAPAATSAPVMGTTVSVGKTDALGSFLVDDKGMTLYLFTKDTPNTSNCYDKCAASWPPLVTTGNPVAGDGVDASKLSTTMRTDGTVQVTYNGWPLYYYAKDKAAGDVTGQTVGDVWFVISAAGDQITTAP
jgi:predicted lipoprotein with Yx(FWY)xxD motif